MTKMNDLTGRTFFHLTVLRRAEGPIGKVYWACRCRCGKEVTVVAVALVTSNTKSCGCLRRDERALLREQRDLTGRKFGAWRVLGRASTTTRDASRRFVVECACGTKKEIRASELLAGKTQSCGCVLALPGDEAGRNALFGTYKNAAKRRGLSFALNKDWFGEITGQYCFYCGCAPAQVIRTGTNRTYVYNGVDRIDNNLGYVLGNMVACCKTCNYAKNTLDAAEFLAWVSRIYNHSCRAGDRVLSPGELPHDQYLDSWHPFAPDYAEWTTEHYRN